MIGWILWTFAALPLLLLDGWLVAHCWPVPVFTWALCVYMALLARPTAIPGVLIVAALARSVLVVGDTALHVLALGLPVAMLVPLRVILFRRHWLAQAFAAGLLALVAPHAATLVAHLGGVAWLPPATGWWPLLIAVVLVPPCVLLLRWSPPLRWFLEKSE